VFDCIRRLFLASFIGIFGSPSSAISPLMGLLIALGCTYVFTKFEPYNKDDDNTLNISLAFSTTLLFIAGLIAKADSLAGKDTRENFSLGVVMIIMFIMAPLVMLVQAASKARRFIKIPSNNKKDEENDEKTKSDLSGNRIQNR
jgi:Ca2+/H+ antiporter